MKQIIVPGEMVSQSQARMDNTYVEGGKTYSKVMGLYDEEHKGIIPLEGPWKPRIDDAVIGIIAEEKNKVYEVDIGFFGRTLLIVGKFDRESYKVGDVIEATIKDVEDRKTIILTMARPLEGGTVLMVKPAKVPRVIGKANTMVRQISEAAKTMIIVGMNGMIWMRGGNVALATAAIKKIEAEAHISGLTERIKLMLEQNNKGN
ncbi:MAG TPA: KH domain-containing protein [Candidatus Baltobacteraceae bacterium]|nr:KH domain-containing protein [Candidatus Baltobacteraceae bacterium]